MILLNNFLHNKKNFCRYSKFAIIFCLFFNILLYVCSAWTAETPKRIKFLIGSYECVSNSDCNRNFQYCSIDDHKCVDFTNLREDCDESYVCSADCDLEMLCYTMSEGTETELCEADKYYLDGACVECRSDKDCVSGSQKYCDVNEHVCTQCPHYRPKWDGDSCQLCETDFEWSSIKQECVCSKGRIFNSETAKCECPSNKQWNESKKICECASGLHWSEAEKKCDSCPAEAPNWDSQEQKCIDACPTGQVWNTSENMCTCEDNFYWHSEISQCVSCSGSVINNQCYWCDSSEGEKYNKSSQKCEIVLYNKTYLSNQPPVKYTKSDRLVSRKSTKYNYTLKVKETCADNKLELVIKKDDKKTTKTITDRCIKAVLGHTWKNTSVAIEAGSSIEAKLYGRLVDWGGGIGTIFWSKSWNGSLTLERKPHILNHDIETEEE